MHELDHLLWEELHLSEGETRFAESTGVTPAFGGKHPDTGTHNSLLSLGQGKYLEIISLDPSHPKAASVLKETPPDFTPRLFAFGVRTYDLARVEQLAKTNALEVERLHDISRKTPDGRNLEWQNIVLGNHDFGDFLPFFTCCGDMVHPSETAPKGCELLEFSVGHPRHQKLSRLYAGLEINVPVFESEQPLLLAILSTPEGRITLDSAAGFQVQ